MFNESRYKKLSEKDISNKIKEKGFNPIKFTDSPNCVYKKHKHPETKLLVFLGGKMEVIVGNQKFNCNKGDELIIPGNTIHSAKVGKSGCTYFWSEKLET